MLNIGFACQIVGVGGYKIHACRLDNADPVRLKEMTAENLATLRRMLEYCVGNEIPLFRISSDVIPFGSHPLCRREWWRDEEVRLAEMGAFIAENGLRVSMHPGQYTVLNSPREDVVERAVEDLAYHTKLLDAMGLPPSHKLILHIGGVYGDKAASVERFVRTASALPSPIRARLVLENDEKMYTAAEVIDIARRVGVPAVMDNLHHSLNHGGEEDFLPLLHKAATTWQPEDGRQKIHYAQQREGGPRGAHSDTIRLAQFMTDSGDFGDIDVMLEVKDKNLSAIKCGLSLHGCKPARLQREWARYKYLIMRHSQPQYGELRARFAGDITPAEFFAAVEDALATPPTPGSIRNTAQHLWGYFKDKEQPARFTNLLEKYADKPGGDAVILSYLRRIAEKHDTAYLLDGYSFYEG